MLASAIAVASSHATPCATLLDASIATLPQTIQVNCGQLSTIGYPNQLTSDRQLTMMWWAEMTQQSWPAPAAAATAEAAVQNSDLAEINWQKLEKRKLETGKTEKWKPEKLKPEKLKPEKLKQEKLKQEKQKPEKQKPENMSC